MTHTVPKMQSNTGYGGNGGWSRRKKCKEDRHNKMKKVRNVTVTGATTVGYSKKSRGPLKS